LPNFLNHVLHPFALWAAWTGREDEALAVVEEMVANARRAGAPPDPHVLYLRPYMLWQRGELEDAGVLVRQALQYPHLAQNLMAKRLIEVLSATLQLAQGDLDGAQAALFAIEAHARQTGMDFVRMQALLPLGRSLLAGDDPARGLAALEAAAAMSGSGPARNPLAYALALADLAEAATATRECDRAQAFITGALAIAADPSQDNLALQARLKASQGDLHAANGRPDLARQAHLEALAAYRALRHTPMQHRLQQRLAAPMATPTPTPAPPDAQVPAWLREAEARRLDG
jgi:tetratricopeptide (TPR) repeat protein